MLRGLGTSGVRVSVALVSIFVTSCARNEAVTPQPETKLQLLDYGVYYPSIKGYSGVSTTISGHINLISSVPPTEQTDTICARLGSAFGFRYSLVEPAPTMSNLLVAYDTPQIVGPNGVAKRNSSHETVIRPGEKHISTYGFDYPYELVAGDWTISIKVGDRTLLARTFHVRTDCPPAQPS